MGDGCWDIAGGERSFSEHINCELVLGNGLIDEMQGGRR